MDYARREFLLTLRRVVAALLALTLLVAFWADRPAAAASRPKPVTGALLRGEDPAAAGPVEEPSGTAVINLVRRPWLAFYQLLGAPDLHHGALSEAEEAQFRHVVLCLAGIFFAVAVLLWQRGQRLVAAARKAS